jgi:hypothetical protein
LKSVLPRRDMASWTDAGSTYSTTPEPMLCSATKESEGERKDRGVDIAVTTLPASFNEGRCALYSTCVPCGRRARWPRRRARWR